jgi:hypothetical protein
LGSSSQDPDPPLHATICKPLTTMHAHAKIKRQLAGCLDLLDLMLE